MSELETKAGAGNVGAAFEDFMRAFEAFKETNDERLYALERRSGADPLIEEKLTRIDRALSSRDIGDASYVAVQHAFEGLGLKPLSPVHVRGQRAGGDVTITWVRRTRMGGDNWETLEVPLGEDGESYEVDILDGATVKRTLSCAVPSAIYAAADQVADFGAAQPSYDVRVYQISASYGRGTARAATV